MQQEILLHAPDLWMIFNQWSNQWSDGWSLRFLSEPILADFSHGEKMTVWETNLDQLSQIRQHKNHTSTFPHKETQILFLALLILAVYQGEHILAPQVSLALLAFTNLLILLPEQENCRTLPFQERWLVASRNCILLWWHLISLVTFFLWQWMLIWHLEPRFKVSFEVVLS